MILDQLINQNHNVLKQYKFIALSLFIHLVGLSFLITGASSLFYEQSQSLDPKLDTDFVEIEFTKEDQDLSVQKLIKTKSKTIKSSAPSRLSEKGLVSETKINKAEIASEPSDQGSVTGNVKKIRMSYDQYLTSYINKYNVYPRIAQKLKQEGTVFATLKILKSGKLESVILKKSSGFSSLDQSALNLIRSRSPFKALPEYLGEQYLVTIPIEYILVSY